jgi:hypothetical protein
VGLAQNNAASTGDYVSRAEYEKLKSELETLKSADGAIDEKPNAAAASVAGGKAQQQVQSRDVTPIRSQRSGQFPIAPISGEELATEEQRDCSATLNR